MAHSFPNIWAVGSPLVMDPTSICRKARRLAGRQAELCQAEPEVVAELARGARLGVRECQFQFRFRRWNCSSHSKAFGRVLQQDIRETAFVFAITAAGASHAVTQACSMGELLQCGCQAPRGRAPPRPTGLLGTPGPPGPAGSPEASAAWEWGGCGDDVDFGDEKSRLFMDAQHKRGRGDIRALVQLHNNEAGRLRSFSEFSPSNLMPTCLHPSILPSSLPPFLPPFLPEPPPSPPSASFAFCWSPASLCPAYRPPLCSCRRCGATRAPSASATGCRVRALCAPAGRSCLRSARWAQGCWNASTEPLASWAPTMAKPCCPQSARSSLQAEPTSSTPPTRPTSVPPIGAPALRARAAAPATAVPRTSAAATCCVAVADTARRAYSSRRTACAASTGAAWCSATAAACARSSACASDPPPASPLRAALLAICGTTGFQQAALSGPSCSLGKIHI
ncbi:protein Wnt-6 isoform X2 [Alexandromys fortis]|uniref:protein Wnt-6 isoform X2 n=1 Tax=Alexandromys fortis TaxID=100897 RepID=UPI002153905D|nr:protein Wnt-6 isoform X2 [Microtus fortis]